MVERGKRPATGVHFGQAGRQNERRSVLPRRLNGTGRRGASAGELCGDAGGWAEVVEEAVAALRAAGDADLAAVEDQAEGEAAPILRGEEGADLVLDLHRVLGLRQAQPAGETADVGVDGEAGQVEGHRAHDVAGLAADAGQL